MCLKELHTFKVLSMCILIYPMKSVRFRLTMHMLCIHFTHCSTSRHPLWFSFWTFYFVFKWEVKPAQQPSQINLAQQTKGKSKYGHGSSIFGVKDDDDDRLLRVCMCLFRLLLLATKEPNKCTRTHSRESLFLHHSRSTYSLPFPFYQPVRHPVSSFSRKCILCICTRMYVPARITSVSI